MSENNDNNGDKEDPQVQAEEMLKQIAEASDRGDFNTAIDLCNKGISLYPHSAAGYNNRGSVYNDKKEYDLAIVDLNRAIELDPDLAGAYNNRGNTYSGKGEYDRALADYNKAIELKPEYANAYSNRGTVYADNGDYDRAIVNYNKAIELDPDLAEAYNNRGNSYAKKGEYDLAIADYNKAIGVKPRYIDAYHNRAIAMAQKDAQKTADEYKRQYEERLTVALAEQEESIRKTFGTLKPEEMLRHYEERAKEYEGRVKKERPETRKYAERLPWRLIGYFLGFAFLYFLLIRFVSVRGSGADGGNGIIFGATVILPLTLGFALISYPLVSELRRRREEDRLNEICAEDSRRKGFIAGYMLAHEDKETRDQAIAKFQEHLADKSAAEFLSGWGKPAKDDGTVSLKNILEATPLGQPRKDDES